MSNLSPTLQILLARFNGQILIPFTAAAESAGIAEQSARNLVAQKRFPIPTLQNSSGSRRFVHIDDLANYIDSLRANSVKSKRGRPTKASIVQSRHDGGAK
jgi:hypothetical protein